VGTILTRQTHIFDRSDGSCLIAPQFPIRNSRVVLRVPELLRLCQDKKVLHLGCTDAPHTANRGEALLHKQLAKITSASNLWGLDISSEGVRILREMGFENVLLANVEQMPVTLHDETFDIILAGEIIEHLPNPGLFLTDLKTIMSDRTQLVLTTVNAFSFKGIIHSVLRREKVNPDHNYYFSYQTIKQLLEKSGFICKDIYYYQEIQGRGLARWLDRVLWLATKISPVWADGIIVRAIVLR
jgi:2-polyprenyl-3-methyl-5-hydroxy-6-metoxy-1,4-benzoquinol methylase